MIIDPQSFVPLELDRRRASVHDAHGRVDRPVRRRQRPRRGAVLRLAAWATGRTAFV